MSVISTRVVTQSEDLEAIRGDWDALLEGSGDDGSVFMAPEWVFTWWKHFGEGKKLNVLLVEREQEVVGIFPLMRTRYAIGPAGVTSLETIGSMDRNCIGLVSPDDSEGVVDAFLDYLGKEMSDGAVIARLLHVPDDSGLLRLLRGRNAQSPGNLAIEERVSSLAPYIVLPATWDEYLSSLDGRTRNSLRRKERRLEEAHLVQFRQCTGASLEDGLKGLFDLHQERWRSVGVRGLFSDPGMKDFFADITRQFAARNWLSLSILTLDGRLASADYGLVYNRKYYGFMPARDVSFSSYSVGHVHIMHVMREAIGRGLREYDFLRGDEPYKFYWTKSARPYVEITMVRKGICTGLYLRYLRAFFRLLEMRQYGLRESYARYRIRRRQEAEKSRMRLHEKLKQDS